LQLATLHPDYEHVLVNIAQHLCEHPNEYQQVQVPVKNSNHQFQQVQISPDKPRDLSLPYQHPRAPENLNRPCSDRKLHSGGGTTDGAQLQSACHCDQFLENAHLPYGPDVTDQLDTEETYYEVCRRNSSPSRSVQVSTTDGIVVSLHEGHTVPFQNVTVQVGFGRNYVDERHAYKNRH
jgi:hypothetical protein